MKLKLLTIPLFTAGILTACGGVNADNALKKNDAKNIKQVVQELSTRNLQADSASITSQQLLVKENDGTEKVYDLPRDEFFVSIAPYVNQTHP